MADYIKLKNEKKPQKRKFRFKFRNLILIVLLFMLLSSIISSITLSITPKIAVVPIKGAIATQSSTSLTQGNYLSSREIATTLYNLKDDSSVKAVLLDINSPGGSIVAAEEITLAINELKKEKPVYSIINDLGASAAYWIPTATDKIYASKSSIVGNIGATSASLGFENLIKEYNITYRKLTSAEHKDIGTPFREPTKEDEKIIMELLQQAHKEFVNQVATGRNMSIEEVENLATGTIFTGNKAKELGLIDEIGLYHQVIKDLKNITNEDVLIINYGPNPTFLEQLGFQSKSTSLVNQNLLIQ